MYQSALKVVRCGALGVLSYCLRGLCPILARLCEKLHIHSQPQKADALEQQVKDFTAVDDSILNVCRE